MTLNLQQISQPHFTRAVNRQPGFRPNTRRAFQPPTCTYIPCTSSIRIYANETTTYNTPVCFPSPLFCSQRMSHSCNHFTRFKIAHTHISIKQNIKQHACACCLQISSSSCMNAGCAVSVTNVGNKCITSLMI